MAKKVKTERKVESVIKPYELMLILSPDLRESDVKKKLKEIVDMIEKADGKVTHEDFWGKKQLAYRFKKCNEGIYMVYNLELPNTFLAELKQHLRIEKDVLRAMIISLPEDHTYTKFDLEVPAEERSKKEKPKKAIKPKEKVEVTPVKEEIKEKEEGVEEKAEKVEEKEEVKKEKPTEEPEDTAETPAVASNGTQPVDAVGKAHVPSTDDEEDVKPAHQPETEEKEELTDKELEEKKRESELDRKLDELLGGDDLKL